MNSQNQSKNPSENPVGLNGVEFIEFAGTDAGFFENLFVKFGFEQAASLPDKKIKLFTQNQVRFVLTTHPDTFAVDFSKKHGPGISATGFGVFNADQAFKTAVQRGAKPFQGSDSQKGALPFPAIYGIGESLIYFMDEKNSAKLYSDIFKVAPAKMSPKGLGLDVVDHFTNNVPVGEMQKWCDFYTNVFNFRETRYFDIRGKQTGLISKVMRSPCNLFAVPINEPAGDKSQIQEYLDDYKGSGIQHLAMSTKNILGSFDQLHENKVDFLSAPPTSYYAMLKDRLPNVVENVDALQKRALLVDGDHEGYLIQIFTKNIIGPIFFEIIQRKNHLGFGEGNFQALFDAIERDQQERGYL